MNIVFLGSSVFAVPVLEALAQAKHKIICVVTRPDRLKGRGLACAQTEVKSAALERGLRVFQPDDVNSPQAIRFLKGLSPDLIAVVSFGQILSKGVLDIPRIFCVNLHASLLPKYRGAAPINWALIRGERQTGVSVIRMNEKMDAGEIILQKARVIGDADTAETLQEKLAAEGAGLLSECVDKIENNNFQLTGQDEAKVSFAPKLKKKDGLIKWQSQAAEIQNLIRGTVNWPGAFTYYKGKLLKIYKAKGEEAGGLTIERLPGEIVRVSKEGIVLATGKDCLVIEELQLEGKRRMRAEEFIAGHKILPGELLGAA